MLDMNATLDSFTETDDIMADLLDRLESPRRVTEDGYDLEASGYRLDRRKGVWLHPVHPALFDHEMRDETAQDILNEALHVIWGRSGATICLQIGGPEVWIDTTKGLAIVATRASMSRRRYVDRIGLGDLVTEIIERRTA